MVKSRYMQFRRILDMIDETIGYIQGLSEGEYIGLADTLEADLLSVIKTVNIELLDSSQVCFCRLDKMGKERKVPGYKEKVIGCLLTWRDKMADVLERQYHASDIWEERFVRLMDRAQYVDQETIVEDVKEALFGRGAEEIVDLCRYYQAFSYLWGTLDVVNDRYDVIENRVAALKEHREDLIWLYDRLGDRRSRLVLTCMLYSWTTFDITYIINMKEANYSDYFDLDLVKCGEEEVVVDLGAWMGDSILNYIQTYGKYKKIYGYEIDPSSMEKMKEELRGYPDIELRNRGVGDKNGTSYFDSVFGSSCNKVTDQDTGKRVELVRLDDDIEEKVTLIKMDIEGAEQDALTGCARHIREERPKLLISVYHNNEDIWKIPRMIMDMRPDYQLYLRSNGAQWGPSEIVLLAIGRSDLP